VRVHRTKNKHKIAIAIQDYNNGASVTQIQRTHGLTISFFKKLLKEHNIEYINRAKNPNKTAFIIIKNNFNKIIEEYENTKNIAAIAKKYNVCSTAIRDWLIRNNIPRRTHKAPTTFFIEAIKSELLNLYNQGLDKSALARKYNLTRYHITKVLKTYLKDKQVRTRSQATTLKNTNPDFQRKVLNSHYRSRPFILPSGRTLKLMGYEDDFLQHVFSNQLLAEQDFEFENKIYIKYTDTKRNHRKYFPDFYIPKLNLIIEIKSTYTLEKQKELNIKKFEAAKKNYNFICIVDKNYKEFNILLKNLSLVP
jgi:Mor family transcriptional regulator